MRRRSHYIYIRNAESEPPRAVPAFCEMLLYRVKQNDRDTTNIYTGNIKGEPLF